MAKANSDVQDLSPYKLMANFSTSRIVPCLVLALVLHVVVIGGTSIDYIDRTFINPQAATQEETAAAEPGEGKQPAKAAPDGGAEKKPAGQQDAGPGKKPTESREALLERHQDKPVIKEITEAADPEEIPDEPDGLGITIEDTNNP